MDKEEIFQKHKFVERRQSEHSLTGGYDFEYLSQDGALKAMDEYARQEAVSFSIWITKNACREGADKWTCRVTQWRQTHTTAELFDLYQKPHP